MSEFKKAIEEARTLYKKGEEITHAKACQLVSCKPTRVLLQESIDKNNSLLKEWYKINSSNSVEILKLIEKIIFKSSKNYSPQVKIGASIYLTSKLTQEVVSEIVGCTMASIRKLISFLENQHEYKRELFMYMPEAIERHGLTDPLCKNILIIKRIREVKNKWS